MVQPTPVLPEMVLQQEMLGRTPSGAGLLSPPQSTGIHGQYHAAQTPYYQNGTAALDQNGTGSQGWFGTGPQRYGTGPQGLSGPLVASTPQVQLPNFNRTLGSAVVGPEVQTSGKYHSLCRCLARLLRPLWNAKIVVCESPARGQADEQVCQGT